MDYLHKSLGEVPIEFRIVHDTTGLGRFARLEDVSKIENLDAITVFHQPPTIEPRVFSILHNFAEEGDFIGLVTVKHPETDQYYSAVFPFHVGATAWGYLPLLGLIAVLSHFGYLFFSGGMRRWRAASRAGKKALQYNSSLSHKHILMFVPALLLLMGAAAANGDDQSWLSKSKNIKLSFHSSVEPLPLNQIHEWTLHFETSDGTPVEHAKVHMKGGMPAHNHGLPTEPVVTQDLGNGDYQVEGMRFHMQGDWVIEVSITYGNNQHDTVLVSLVL
jgi:hypothetical protein